MIRDERGMTLIELMICVLVICGGVLATLATYTHFSDASNVARERAVLNSVAQREMEQLRALDFASLGLSAMPPSDAAPLTGPAAGEAKVSGGVVDPGGSSFRYQGAEGTIYRYVTWRTLSCSGLTAKVQADLSTIFTQSLSQVQAAIPDVCPTVDRTKRVSVVVISNDENASPRPVVRSSTIMRDPGSVLEATSGATTAAKLALKKAVASTGATGAISTTTTQSLNLLDTRCSSPVRLAPGDHATRDTSQASFTCSPSGPAPTLMTLTGYGGDDADPVHDYSTDVTRAATGGLAMLRDTKAGSCTATDSLVYTNAETDERKRSIHTWASTVPAGNLETATSGGRASLALWSSTADGTRGPARLCVTLRRANGALLGSSDFSLASWPDTPTELVTAFDLDHAVIPSGERLLLTVRVPADSGEDLRLLFDHPKYRSLLTLTFESGSSF